MHSLKKIVVLLLCSTLSGWAQPKAIEHTYSYPQSKYLLTAYLSSGEVIKPTGRILRTIAIDHPRNMEVSNIWLNYNLNIKLKSNLIGETIAVVSFTSLKLSGDVDYKGFDISDHIFPSLVSFKLFNQGTTKKLIATVKAVSINQNDCTVYVTLPKNTKEIPIIDQLEFYHSDQDFEKADYHIKLIDKYYTAEWLMQRANKLLDECQLTYSHNPPSYLAKNLEVIVITDWLASQHFNRYQVFQKKDSLEMTKYLEISHLRKNLIDQEFIKQNVISNEDLLEAAKLFADNMAFYFDSSQPNFNRETNLTKMAESQLSTNGYITIREFGDSYEAVHKLPNDYGQLLQKFTELIHYAMTVKASQLFSNDKYSEALSMLTVSANYNRQKGPGRSQVDSLLKGKLIQRLYDFYLDFALKSLKSGISSITEDFYQKAILLKEKYLGLIRSDPRERYLANIICKIMLASAEKSIKSKDIKTALANFEKVIQIAESERLKANYVIAIKRLETISNRPSGFKPWVGADLAIDMAVPSQSVSPANDGSLEVKKIRKQILDDIQNIHLKIWIGDTIASVAMLHKSDSLQQLLAASGDHSMEAIINDFKNLLGDKRCDYQNIAYHKELEQIQGLVKSKGIDIAAKQLQLLIEKPYSSRCKVDKSEAISLLSTFESPLLYNKQIIYLDSITRTQEPGLLIKAFEKVNDYYRANMIEKFGIEPPDIMVALKSRRETTFLLKAASLMLDDHRPVNAFELLKEIKQLEPKSEMTNSLQKRLGEMLAAGDHDASKTSTEMLKTYNLNDRWYKELISAYKKQWKNFYSRKGKQHVPDQEGRPKV